jgi:hypothetical protein
MKNAVQLLVLVTLLTMSFAPHSSATPHSWSLGLLVGSHGLKNHAADSLAYGLTAEHALTSRFTVSARFSTGSLTNTDPNAIDSGCSSGCVFVTQNIEDILVGTHYAWNELLNGLSVGALSGVSIIRSAHFAVGPIVSWNYALSTRFSAGIESSYLFLLGSGRRGDSPRIALSLKFGF